MSPSTSGPHRKVGVVGEEVGGAGGEEEVLCQS